ncbi:Glutaredoxin-3 [Trichoplax sp. H2]|nr:Glutaredoxin-3 [Trichoplax sp. H2]|eukprot:RDD37402.1 Glutaredoxin-3 [Trichoplax sp. H2]
MLTHSITSNFTSCKKSKRVAGRARKFFIMLVVSVSTPEEFNDILQEVGSALTVVHFWATWAAQCLQMNVVLDELANKYLNIKFVKIEAESMPEISLQYNIAAVPTFILMKAAKEIDRINGANTSLLVTKVGQHTNTTVPVSLDSIQTPQETKEEVNSRIKKLLNSHKCMLFMKGVPDEPKCGFSRQLINILNDHNVDYGYFNILSDNEIRQGLKKYSDWPTYPQLYVDGEMLGGLDIVKDMIESGDFASMVPKKQNVNERIEKLLKSSKVLLFMKGSPDTPKCGFSKRTCEILNETGVAYATFDILADQEVRAGLKKYSDWPTYPQLYVDGQFIGGLDIIEEMYESNELITCLKGE